MSPGSETETLLSVLKLDAQGLVPVIAQDIESGSVRMFAWANREALELTASTGFAHFWSRSRGALWKKGESSGHTLAVRELRIDCDGDVVLYRVEPDGPSCHTGATSCFFRAAGGLRAAGGVGCGEREQEDQRDEEAHGWVSGVGAVWPGVSYHIPLI